MRVWSVLVGLLLGSSAAWGQDLSVYTRTVDLTGLTESSASRAPVVARSLTLFHAGLVYDYIDSLREVTIYEPAHRRFTVLHEAAQVAAVVTQDEVRRYLEIANGEAREIVVDRSRRTDPDAATSLAFLQFQLQPEFDVSWVAGKKRLSLNSPQFRYDVDCADPPEPAVLAAYLRYVEAMTDLNAVLHPQALLPGPRSRLNDALREHNQLPMTVTRWTNDGGERVLRAEHKWTWQLTEPDRQRIAYWESQLRKKDLRRVTFKQLQQEVLGRRVTQR